MACRTSFALVALTALVLKAQTTTATIEGAIRDSTGAAVAGATVRLINANTASSQETTANSEGRYLIPYLLPDVYTLTVARTGFRRFQQSGIKLDVQQVLSLDITLTVGDVGTTVEVAGNPTPLATSSSVVSATMENKAIVDLPLNGRVALGLSLLVPGVIPSEGVAGSSLGVVDGSPYPHSRAPNIAGARNATSDVQMDGIPLSLPNTTGGTMALGVSGPTVDAVQEFTVFTSVPPAEYGRTAGGIINIASKTGVNKFHGSAYEFVRNSVLDANFFFSNRAGIPRADFSRNHFGGSFGGPLWIPKVYNGRNRTFFFFDIESTHARVPNVLTTSVPLPEWTAGDFSNLKAANGAPISIYDPATTRPDGAGNFTRDAFASNRIPASRFDTVGRNIAKYYPAPNATATDPNTQANNWARAGIDKADALDFGVRVDHNITDRWRTFARATHGGNTTVPQNFFDSPATPLGRGTQPFVRHAYVWDNTYALNPTTVFNVRYGVARISLYIFPLSYGFDTNTLGFPAYLKTEASKNLLRFPRIDATNFTSLGQASGAGLTFVPTSHNVLGTMTKILNRHTIKAGYEYRKLYFNFWQETVPTGQFTFNTAWTQRVPNTSSSTQGFPLASLLLGLPASGSQTNTIQVATSSSYYAGFVQDDFRVSNRLTLNLGFRYDIDLPRTERFDQQSYFDTSAPSPIAGKVPGFPNLVGAMQFTGPGHRRQVSADTNNVSPRFGFAFKVDSKTAFRGGYALMYGPSIMQAGYKGTEGFRTSTAMTVSLDNRIPLNYMSNPFPYGFNQALGKTPGPDSGAATDIGLTVGDSWFPANDSPVVQQWNATLQRELPGQVLVEVGYLANKGNHLDDGEALNYNQLPASYLPLGNQLGNLVANPFADAITNPNSTLSRPTVTYRQLQSKYPQYSSVSLSAAPFGNSIYHGFTLRAERRFSQGIGFRVAYTGGKLIDDCSFASTVNAGGATTRQDVYNRGLDRSLSADDVSSRFVTSVTYEAPFGRGHTLLSSLPPVANALLGGWQMNGIITWQTGLPVIITQSVNVTGLGNTSQRPNNNGHSAILTDRSKSEQLAQWLNPAVFSLAPAFTFGTASRTLPDVRQPGKRNFDLSLFKTFPIGEKVRATFRAEAFNAFNTAQFGWANTQVGNTNFGVISSTSVSPRQVQLAVKLNF